MNLMTGLRLTFFSAFVKNLARPLQSLKLPLLPRRLSSGLSHDGLQEKPLFGRRAAFLPQEYTRSFNLVAYFRHCSWPPLCVTVPNMLVSVHTPSSLLPMQTGAAFPLLGLHVSA